MHGPLPDMRWTPNRLRRAAAATLLALQAVIALSPVLERRETLKREAHLEQTGSRHLLAHDDATCLMCAARTLMGNAATVPPSGLTTTATDCVDIVSTDVARAV